MNLTIFDLDNTILNGDSDYSWIKFLIDSNHVDVEEYTKKNEYFYQKYYQGNLDYYEWAEFALSTIKDKDISTVKKLLDIFLAEIIEPMINIYALKIIHDHHHIDDVLLLASATNNVIVEPIGKRLGFSNIVATEVETINDVYTGKINGIPALGEGKLLKVKEWMKKNNFLDFNNVTFYTDSINDLPLLKVVQNPIAVNPDTKLKQICIEKNWKIKDLP
ncbi:MAG: HAD-IB family hydrolase [Gammaproteobacteria bacterium]|nr:HAD-IB family hydrolase [Gammaproteobacteria bacterium]